MNDIEIKIRINKDLRLARIKNVLFNNGKLELERLGYGIVSLEDYASVMIQKGVNFFRSPLKYLEDFYEPPLVSEGIMYVPGKGNFLTKKSPIMENMENATKATNYHMEGMDFYLKNNQIEEALADSVALSGKPIPFNRFSEEESTVYAFSKNYASKIGEFLLDASRTEEKSKNNGSLNLYLADAEDMGKKSFIRQIFFYTPFDGECGFYTPLFKREESLLGIRHMQY